ncbi:MAG: hypothetical protein U0X92_08370 [Anaerolineales bacterium]
MGYSLGDFRSRHPQGHIVEAGSPKVESRYIFKPADLLARAGRMFALSGPAPRIDRNHSALFVWRHRARGFKVATSKIGGLVLGMARIVVTPPAGAAWVTVSQSSLWVCPGSRTWT